mmetsp:Transcript_32793/g.84691  ORF Transcript_32793/g.84691 Transcript_32793/m.84691 type:complete len:246 (+) Transcript_32793:411-1148(+)
MEADSQVLQVIEVLICKLILHIFDLFLLLVSIDFLLFIQCLFELLLGEVVDISICTSLQALQKLVLDCLIQLGCSLCLRLPFPLSLFFLLLHCHQFFLGVELHLSHSNEILVNFGQPLLIFVYNILRPVCKVLVELLQCLCVVLVQFNLFPHILGGVGPFHCLQHQVASTINLLYCCILAVCKWATLTIAQPGEVVFISAKSLYFGHLCFDLEGAKLLVNHIPYHFVALHDVLLFYPDNRCPNAV